MKNLLLALCLFPLLAFGQAGTKISALPAAGPITGPELVPLVQGGTNVAAAMTSLIAFLDVNFFTGAITTGHCAQFASPTTLSDAGAACGGGGGGGSGTVNSGTAGQVAYYAANGNTVSGAALGNNLAFTSGVLQTTQAINAQTGTTYAIASSDAGKLITFSNGAATAVSLPQATTAGFTAGFSVDVQNLANGLVTITPATSTIYGSPTLTVAQNTGCTITSDGTNYQVSACSSLPSPRGITTGAVSLYNVAGVSVGGLAAGLYYPTANTLGFAANGGNVGSWSSTLFTSGTPMVLSPGYLIAALPACNGVLTGANAFVTNAQTTPTYLGAVSTTGAVTAPVFCNGTSWVYH
jgi:hypothetical protein